MCRGSLWGTGPGASTQILSDITEEFYEARWFAPGVLARSREVLLDGASVPFGADLLFEAPAFESLKLGVEVCEDLWMPNPLPVPGRH